MDAGAIDIVFPWSSAGDTYVGDNEVVHPTRVIMANEPSDLTLLTLIQPIPGVPGRRYLDLGEPDFDEAFQTWGYTGYTERSGKGVLVRGTLKERSAVGGMQSLYLETHIGFLEGMSGGPVVQQGPLRVIGLVKAKLGDLGTVNGQALDLSRIHEQFPEQAQDLPFPVPPEAFEEERVTPRPPWPSTPHLPTRYFFGRDLELVQVDGHLTSTQGEISWAVIEGPPGIGKSELALQYAHRYLDQFPGGIYWLDAKIELSKQWWKRALSVGVNPRELDPEMVVYEVLRIISCRPRLLVVLDNADQWAPLEPQLPRGDGHAFLVTSRVRGFGGHQFQGRTVVLEPLDADSVGDLVRAVMGERARSRPEDVNGVVRTIGGHPQALAFAAGYLARKKRVPVERFVLEPAGIRHPQGYPEMMSQILREVGSKQQGSLKIFCLTGLYEDAPAPRSILQETWNHLEEKADFEDSWDALVDAYLVQEVKGTEEAWTMLPFLREIARRQEGITAGLRAAHAEALEAYLERLEESGEDIPPNLLAHVEYLESRRSAASSFYRRPADDVNRVAVPVYRRALSIMGGLLLMVVCWWGIWGSVPVTVEGDGILVRGDEVRVYSGPNSRELPVRLGAIVFVPAQEGKRVRIGMPALLSLSDIQPEQAGYLMAHVSSRSIYLVRLEAVESELRNDDRVRRVLEQGLFYRVDLQIVEDKLSPNRLRWTGRGTREPIEPGRGARASFVVERRRPVSYVLPFLRKAL